MKIKKKLFILIIFLSSFFLITIIFFEFNKNKEIEKYKEEKNNLTILLNICEEFKEKEKEIENIIRTTNNEIILNKYDNRYIFYYNNKNNISNIDSFKKKYKIKKFNFENNLKLILKNGKNKILNELNQIKKKFNEKKNNNFNEFINNYKKKLSSLKKEIEKIKSYINEINNTDDILKTIIIINNNQSFFFI